MIAPSHILHTASDWSSDTAGERPSSPQPALWPHPSLQDEPYCDFGREANIIDLAGRGNLGQATPGVLFSVITMGKQSQLGSRIPVK